MNDPPPDLRPDRSRRTGLRKKSVRDTIWSCIASLLLHALMFAVMISPVLQLPIVNAAQRLDFFWLSPFFTLESTLTARSPEGIVPPPLPNEEPADEETDANGKETAPAADLPEPPRSGEPGGVAPLADEESAAAAEMVVPRRVLVTAPPPPVDDGIQPPRTAEEPEQRLQQPPDEDRLALLQAEQARLAGEEAARQARERAEAERLRLEKEQRERLAREAEKERDELRRREEAERFAREKARRELLAKEQAERDRLHQEQVQRDRLAREAEDRLKKEREELHRKEEAERSAREKVRQEQLARERAEQERQRLEKSRQEQLARERAERERLQREEQRRLAEQRASERAEQERLVRERAEAARRAEDERRAKELGEQNRLAAERAWLEQLARMKAQKVLAETAKTQPAAPATRQASRESTAEPKGIPVPTLNGDIKLTIAGGGAVTVTASFRPFAKSRRNRPLSRSESKREIAIVPIMVNSGDNTREAVVEKSREGIYTLVVAPAGAETKVAFTLTLFEKSSGTLVKELGSRSIGKKTVVARILMPEGILWDDDAAFSGSMEDSEGVTKFNSETGLVWKEYGE